MILAGSLFLSGCTVVPVYNIVDAPVPTKKANLKSIKTAILRATSATGWRAKETSPGIITANYLQKSSIATIAITYSAKTFSIQLKEAKQLEFNGVTIHRKYNKWIMRLDKKIVNQLRMLDHELD